MKSEKGQAAVEFALILPFLLILILGIIDFGRVLYTKDSLNSICQQTTRDVSIVYSKPVAEGGGALTSTTIDTTYVPKYNAGKLDDSLLEVNNVTYDTESVKIVLRYKITFITPYLDHLLNIPKDAYGNYWISSNATFRLE